MSGEAWLASRAFEAESVSGPARSGTVLRLGPARRVTACLGGTQPGPSPGPWSLGSGTPWLRILESKLPSLSSTRWGALAGLQVSCRPGTLELALQLPLLLFGSVHKKAPAPPPAPPSRPHAPTPPHPHTPPPTPAVGQMTYSLRLGARTGEGLKLWGWPFKWLLAPPPL